jgi:hypothetical protein
MKAEARLYCWDFDGVIVTGNLHDDLVREKIRPTDSDEIIVKAVEKLVPLERLKYKEDVAALMRKMLAKGDKVAITSFNAFPKAIEIVLKKLGLSDKAISEIHLLCGMEYRNGQEGKNGHLESAMKHFGIKDKKYTSLIDDDALKNIQAAQKAGYSVVQVGLWDNDHINELEGMLEIASSGAAAFSASRDNLSTSSDATEEIEQQMKNLGIVPYEVDKLSPRDTLTAPTACAAAITPKYTSITSSADSTPEDWEAEWITSGPINQAGEE